MGRSQWHKRYEATVAAPPAVLFDLLADLPGYGRWLPGSAQFARTTEVEPYPVRLGTRYHDGKPGEGNSWRGSVIGFQPPGSLDFHQTIAVRQLRATVDVHIHYSFEPLDGREDHTALARWLLLDLAMPFILAPLRRFVIAAFDRENVRTIAAVKAYAEAHPSGPDPTEK